MTSPPYGNSTSVGEKGRIKDLNNSAHGCHVRYDVYNDNKTVDEYIEFIIKLFDYFDKILVENGVVLYNFSYSTQSVDKSMMYIDLLYKICHDTPFMIIDYISWKKTTALPIQASNKLSRVCEPIYVIARKSEYKTFKANKPVSKIVNTTKFYGYVTNFIIAKNNDGVCNLNKACFSSELVKQLLSLYCYSKDLIVYDPFMGTGTTAVGCLEYGCNYLGTEISKAQCEFAEERIKKFNQLILC